MGLKGNLTSGEIIEQLIHVKRTFGHFRNVVFMVHTLKFNYDEQILLILM